MSRQTPTRARRRRTIGVLSILIGSFMAVVAPSAQAADPGFAPEGTNTYTDIDPGGPACPNAFAGTPGSDPASKQLNDALNDESSFEPGGTVHYIYKDNPNQNDTDFELQDCVVAYPADKFEADDFDANGELIDVTKSDLTSDATELDVAALSGFPSSTADLTYSWTSPADIDPGTWVCNFARDVNTGHGGGGNRKVSPVCYQIPPLPEAQKPQINPDVNCGPDNDTVTIPDTEGVTYTNPDDDDAVVNGLELDVPGSGLTIVAYAEDGYTLADPDEDSDPPSWTFEFTDDDTSCTVQKPTINQDVNCGPDNDTFVVPDVDGVTWTVDGNAVDAGDVITISDDSDTLVGTADQGVDLENADPNSDPETWTYEFTDGNTSCGSPNRDPDPPDPDDPVEPAAPEHNVALECEAVDTYTIPSTDHVEYQIDGETVEAGTYDLAEDESVTIVAVVVDDGFVLADGADAEWGPFVGSAVTECATGGGGTVIPPVAPVLPFTPEPEPPAAPVAPVLAFTGSDTSITLWAGLGLVGLGLALVLMSKTPALVALSRRPYRTT